MCFLFVSRLFPYRTCFQIIGRQHWNFFTNQPTISTCEMISKQKKWLSPGIVKPVNSNRSVFLKKSRVLAFGSSPHTSEGNGENCFVKLYNHVTNWCFSYVSHMFPNSTCFRLMPGDRFRKPVEGQTETPPHNLGFGN